MSKVEKCHNVSIANLKCDECEKIIPVGAEYWFEDLGDREGPCEFYWCLDHGKEFENVIINK